MAVVDELVTEFKLKDDYSGAASKIAGATSRLAGSLPAAGTAALAVAAGFTAAGAGVLGLANRSINAAADQEILAKSLKVVTGDAQRAAEVFEFVKQQALPSAFFGTRELGNAAKALETFRLKTEDFLPVANTMASLFGQNEESLMSFVYALGRIKAGSFGEGFERLREMGITREMLEKRGLTFSKSNQFEGTSDQALKAIRQTVMEEFGTLDEEMSSSWAASMATLGDLSEQSFARIGASLIEQLLPQAQAFGEEWVKILDSGAFETLGTALADLLSIDVDSTSLGSGMKNLLASITSVLQVMEAYGDWWGGNFNKVRDALYWFATGDEYKGDTSNLTSENLKAMESAAGVNQLKKDLAEQRKKKAEELKKAAGLDTGETPAQVSPVLNKLQQIVQNTEPLKDMRNAMFGGGELARQGISPITLNAPMTPRSRRLAVAIADAGFGGSLAAMRVSG
jgi:hypothetical protein